MEKGQKIEMLIHDMSHEGKGIGNYEGMAVFAEGAVIGDRVRACITKVKKNYAFAVTEEIIEKSEDRIESMCPYSELCGGCALSCLEYSAQLKVKEKQVRDRLQRIGGIENPVIRDIISMEIPFRYRNKAQMPAGDGKVGFFREKSHEIADVHDCLIQSEAAMAVADAVRNSGEKAIKHVVVRTAYSTGQVMVILVMGESKLNDLEKLVLAMDDAVYELEGDFSLESVYLNEKKKNDKSRNVLGTEYIPVAGSRTIIEEVKGFSFEISPASFYQVNPVQMEKLYDKAVEYMELTGKETVLDLYCGVGTIGIYASEKAGSIIGIESVKEAVIDANRNAVINGVVNARYITGRAEEVMPELLEGKYLEQGIKADKIHVAVVDPPRTGCDERLLEALVKCEPERIVYVSCDPSTLARDVAYLRERGYEFVEATPVDMFPWTHHVESVCLLSKVQN